MTIKYVIRRNDFSYNDEWYQTHQAVAGSIQAIYTDQAEAIQAYKQLIVDALYEDGELCNYDIGNGYASEETYEKLKQFVLEKTGEEFEIDDEIPEMELDDAFEFAQISGVLHYQLIEIDQQKPIYILWSNEEQSYLTNYDFNTVFDSQNENFDDLDFDQLYPVIEEHFEEQIFNKNLNDISDSPALFKNLIQDITAIAYSTDENSITEVDWDELTFIQLKSMNALLKQPFFEIRKITLEQLNKITNGEENE